MSNIYKYIGKIDIAIPNLGVVKPDETIETSLEINHPLFKKTYLVKNKKNKKK